jgi:hypothetical protein
MTLPLPPQTHYSLPFGQRLSYGYCILVVALGLCAIFIGTTSSNDTALRIVVLTILIFGPSGMVLALLTDPSFGVPHRRTLNDAESGHKVSYYAIRPLFARKRFEHVGGFHRSRLNLGGQMADYNAPYIAYELYGRLFTVRWEPALMAVKW